VAEHVSEVLLQLDALPLLSGELFPTGLYFLLQDQDLVGPVLVSQPSELLFVTVLLLLELFSLGLQIGANLLKKAPFVGHHLEVVSDLVDFEVFLLDKLLLC
jgi:hypothetical protein